MSFYKRLQQHYIFLSLTRLQKYLTDVRRQKFRTILTLHLYLIMTTFSIINASLLESTNHTSTENQIFFLQKTSGSMNYFYLHNQNGTKKSWLIVYKNKYKYQVTTFGMQLRFLSIFVGKKPLLAALLYLLNLQCFSTSQISYNLEIHEYQIISPYRHTLILDSTESVFEFIKMILL